MFGSRSFGILSFEVGAPVETLLLVVGCPVGFCKIPPRGALVVLFGVLVVLLVEAGEEEAIPYTQIYNPPSEHRDSSESMGQLDFLKKINRIRENFRKYIV